MACAKGSVGTAKKCKGSGALIADTGDCSCAGMCAGKCHGIPCLDDVPQSSMMNIGCVKFPSNCENYQCLQGQLSAFEIRKDTVNGDSPVTNGCGARWPYKIQNQKECISAMSALYGDTYTLSNDGPNSNNWDTSDPGGCFRNANNQYYFNYNVDNTPKSGHTTDRFYICSNDQVAAAPDYILTPPQLGVAPADTCSSAAPPGLQYSNTVQDSETCSWVTYQYFPGQYPNAGNMNLNGGSDPGGCFTTTNTKQLFFNTMTTNPPKSGHTADRELVCGIKR